MSPRIPSVGATPSMSTSMAARLVLDQYVALWRAFLTGWTSEDLAEAYGYIGLVSLCDWFVRYAKTGFDAAFAAAAS